MSLQYSAREVPLRPPAVHDLQSPDRLLYDVQGRPPGANSYKYKLSYFLHGLEKIEMFSGWL
jgi:hypothetical protein